MTADELYDLVLTNSELVDFKGHIVFTEGNLSHCGNVNGCYECPFSSGEQCLLFPKHTPQITSTLSRIQATHPELFI